MYETDNSSYTQMSMNDRIKIEAVTTCVGYADFLAHTLPLNKTQFEKMVVVTAPEDKATIAVCEHHGVRYHRTDSFRSRWGEFHKGTSINEGLALLDKDSWLVHLDADIILPSHFNASVSRAELDRTMIYGCDRLECQSYEAWQEFFGAPVPQIQGNGVFIHTTHSPFRFATRVQFPDSGGWIPIGFFQMWHPESGALRYPAGHTNAGREDSLFAKQWPRSKRSMLPEVMVYHLESEQAPMAVNWNGRKTKKFSIKGE